MVRINKTGDNFFGEPTMKSAFRKRKKNKKIIPILVSSNKQSMDEFETLSKGEQLFEIYYNENIAPFDLQTQYDKLLEHEQTVPFNSQYANAIRKKSREIEVAIGKEKGAISKRG